MKKRLDKLSSNYGVLFYVIFVFIYCMNGSVGFFIEELPKSDPSEYDYEGRYFYGIGSLILIFILWVTFWYSSPKIANNGISKISFFGIPKFARWGDVIRVVDKVPTDNLNDHSGTIKFYTTKYKYPIVMDKIIFNEQNIDMHDIIASKLPDGIMVEPETSKTNQLYQAYQEEKKAITK